MEGEDLRAWFDSIDIDQSGQLDSGELQRALALGSLHFSEDHMHTMIRAFSQTKQLYLTLPEFAKLHAFLTETLANFDIEDQDRTGVAGLDQLEHAVRAAGFALERPSLMALMTRYDDLRRGVVDRAQYVQICMFLQATQATFHAFDAQGNGHIQLDYSQFVYACSHVA